MKRVVALFLIVVMVVVPLGTWLGEDAYAASTSSKYKSYTKSVYLVKKGNVYTSTTSKKKVLAKGVLYRVYKTDGKKVGRYTRVLVGDKVGYIVSSNLSTKRPKTNIVAREGAYYDFGEMKSDIIDLVHLYPESMKASSIGKTADNRDIYCIRIGNPKAKKQIVVDASLHAREYLNSYFVMEMIEYYLNNYKKKTAVNSSITYEQLFQDVALYIIPMANPDGVTVSQYGPSKIRNTTLRNNLKKMLKKKSYRLWKANARGVDLNRNFNGGFGNRNTVKHPGSDGYIGKKAESERESKAIATFINRLSNPVAVINYHSTGSMIYWDYNVSKSLKTKMTKMAKEVNRLTKYRLVKGSSTGGNSKPAGGLGDWCAYTKKIPTVTIETGTVSCPLPNKQYATILQKNKYVIETITNQFYEKKPTPEPTLTPTPEPTEMPEEVA